MSISIVSWVGIVRLSSVVWLVVRSRVACGFAVVHSFGWVFARFFFFLSFLSLSLCECVWWVTILFMVCCVCALNNPFVCTLVVS